MHSCNNFARNFQRCYLLSVGLDSLNAWWRWCSRSDHTIFKEAKFCNAAIAEWINQL